MAWKKTGIAPGAFPPGSLREVRFEGTTVLLVRVAEQVHALQNICPHAGGILADGTLTGAQLSCPEHGARFDVTSGAVLADPDGVEPPQGAIEPLLRYPTSPSPLR